MREQVEHGCHVAQAFVAFHPGDTERHHHETDLRDRGKGQHSLDVRLHAGNYRRVEGRDRSHDRDQHEYLGGLEVIHGEQASHEVNPGNHHRGRVDQCRHGGGTFHGIR